MRPRYLRLHRHQLANHLLIISGISGEKKFSEAFQKWSTTLIEASQKRFGLSAENIVYLADNIEKNPERIHARSTKEEITRAINDLADKAGNGDNILILLIGHGSSRDDTAFFNLPGPDISSNEFAELLEPLAAQKLAFVNTTAASGSFISDLSAPNRVVISATASPAERYFTEFGGHFINAFAEQGADINKDQRISMLEAFDYARREVERRYESANLMQSEHALLDDNGDGEGSLEPDMETGDGALAHTIYFEVASLATVTALTSDNPQMIALLDDKQNIEQRIEQLKQEKPILDREVYYDRLEVLLVELALKHREMRDLGSQ